MNPETLRSKYEALAPVLTERTRRLWAATEAKALGRGGIAIVARATGMSRERISRGIQELRSSEPTLDPARTRRPGGGRKRKADTDPTLWPDLNALVEPMTAGSPDDGPLRWTSKGTRKLADELQANRKTKEGSAHSDRDAQFVYLHDQVRHHQQRGLPVISVDTKKKELIGDFKNPGREWRPKGDPDRVKVHDFIVPAQGVKPLSVPEKEPPYMTRDQVAQFYPECRDWLYTFVAIALNTGLRLAEILSLTWADVELTSGVIKVRSDSTFTTKSKRNREIPINGFLYRVLKRTPLHISCPNVIFTARGNPAQWKLVYKRFKYALKKAGLPSSFRIHDMRHTFGTTLAASGVDVRTIQELMGHASLRTTEQYLHAAPSRMRGAVETLRLDGSEHQEIRQSGQNLDTGTEGGNITY